MTKLDEELKKLGKPHEFHSYENAGHAFLDNTKESYRRHADEASWPRTSGILGATLNSNSLMTSAADFSRGVERSRRVRSEVESPRDRRLGGPWKKSPISERALRPMR